MHALHMRTIAFLPTPTLLPLPRLAPPGTAPQPAAPSRCTAPTYSTAFSLYCTVLPLHRHRTADEKVEYSYINLLRNSERYTGYKGEHAARVWGAIYAQDIFRGVNDADTPPEQRVFYR